MMVTMPQLSENLASGDRRRTSAEEVGKELLRLLGGCRPEALSLHDGSGEVLWLSDGSIGPDEHGLVLSALDVFTLEPQRGCIYRKLDDGRRALFVPARDPLGGCSGLGFAIIELRTVDESRVVTPPIRALLQRLSMMLAPQVEKRSALPGRSQSLTPGQLHSIDAGVDTGIDVKLPENLPIHARSYTRLQPGSGRRRYEVTIAPANARYDLAVFERLVEWLAQNRQRYIAKPSSFALQISADAALNPGFVAGLGACLSRGDMEPGISMLLVPAAAWATQPQAVLPLLEACHRLHCHVILDDFVLSDVAVELLRNKAIRMIKLDGKLTSNAMQERYPRALLAACIQIARVLGIHCVAKHVETPAASRWLTTAGIDYIDPSSPASTEARPAEDEPPLQQVS